MEVVVNADDTVELDEALDTILSGLSVVPVRDVSLGNDTTVVTL